MYCSKIDPARALAVWCWYQDTATAEEWHRHLADMDVVRQWKHVSSRPCVLIYTHEDKFVPNATQRRDIAERSKHPDYTPNLAIISRNPLMRGVMRVFSWFQSQEPYRIAAFPDVRSAVSWLEADRGERLPKLLELLTQAQRELGIPMERQLLRQGGR
jgi:hypothetical protein